MFKRGITEELVRQKTTEAFHKLVLVISPTTVELAPSAWSTPEGAILSIMYAKGILRATNIPLRMAR